ncbi:hypothetical protein [Maridesulfovibrio sp.]|uniref:PD-(D/E)XK nuclease domain-containing protein n=1 Tax=Maridesulfovibrio sp. TaxID=2795000 RepID=UPI0038B331E8
MIDSTNLLCNINKLHPDCDYLVCFIYNPAGFVSNPTDLINDLESQSNSVSVIIKPTF